MTKKHCREITLVIPTDPVLGHFLTIILERSHVFSRRPGEGQASRFSSYQERLRRNPARRVNLVVFLPPDGVISCVSPSPTKFTACVMGGCAEDRDLLAVHSNRSTNFGRPIGKVDNQIGRPIPFGRPIGRPNGIWSTNLVVAH